MNRRLQAVALPAAAVALVAVGILFVYSSGVNSSRVQVSDAWIRQLAWAVTGIGIMAFLAFFDLGMVRMVAAYAYGVNLLVLVLTLLIGREVNGSRSWLGIGELGIQPSEFMKVTTVLFLAVYLAGIGNGVRELPRFLLGLMIVLVPMGLVLLEPDMGTTLVFIPIFLVMAFIAGAKAKHLGFFLLAGTLMVVLAVAPSLAAARGRASTLAGLPGDPEFLKYYLPAVAVVTGLAFLGWRWTRARYFYWIAWSAAALLAGSLGSAVARAVLRDYQIMRLAIFLDPQLDPLRAGWNIVQSVTAIGSGGPFGKGFLQGTQSHFQYLPQQSTDFIFSIIAEEWGFFGSCLVLGLYLLILLRGLSAVWATRDEWSMLVGMGLLGVVFFHVLVNVGMAMGVMPVTGIPLLFLSYGGSSLWMALAAVGLLVNIDRKRLR